MKLEKLMKALSNAVFVGVPTDSEIKEIETMTADGNVESVTVTVKKDEHIFRIHASWQTKDEDDAVMDREKVITEIEDALSGDLAKAGHVYRMSLNGLKDKALKDAIALLKEDCHNCKLECLLQKYDELKEKYDALLKEQGWTPIMEDGDGYLHGIPGDDGQYLMTDGKDI